LELERPGRGWTELSGISTLNGLSRVDVQPGVATRTIWATRRRIRRGSHPACVHSQRPSINVPVEHDVEPERLDHSPAQSLSNPSDLMCRVDEPEHQSSCFFGPTGRFRYCLRRPSGHAITGLAMTSLKRQMTEYRIASLGKAATAQMERLLPLGHSQLLEQTIARLHLALTYTEALSTSESVSYARPIADCLARAFAVGQNNLDLRLESDSPIALVISYPRSGNTVLIRTLARLLQAQIFEGFPHSLIPFSKSIYPKHYPLARLIKDHVPRSEYLNDKAVFLIRDGRDTMISLAHMTFRQGQHNFSKKGQLSLFIRWLEQEYEYFGWANHMRRVDSLLIGQEKLLVRYEDFMADLGTLKKVVNFIDPDSGNSEEDVRTKYEERSKIFDDLGQNPHARVAWGIGEQFAQDSLFYDWSHNRQTSHWRHAWDDEAKVAFHETGATDYLLRYGYETDAEWWRPAEDRR
jgi:hypothetical protein